MMSAVAESDLDADSSLNGHILPPLFRMISSARVGDGGDVRAAIRLGLCAILANLLWSAAARPERVMASCPVRHLS
jgi:hypothetical protein